MATVKEHVTGRLTSARDAYLGDLKAMSQEDLTVPAGGKARTPADFTYEVVLVNQRIAKRMSGGDPGEFKFEGWMKATEEYASKESIISNFETSVNDILNEFEKVPEEDMFRLIETPNGETSPMDLAAFAATHITYHDAQLNFIQALKGDEEMHWG